MNPRLSVIPAAAVTDARLEARDLQALCLLGRHIDDAGWCRRSQVKMARELRCARSTLQASLQRLVEANYVEHRIEVRPSGGDAAHSYRVMLDPAWAPKEGADQSAGVPPQERQGVPTHASAPMLTTPLNENEREGAREDEQSLPDADRLAELRALAPTAAHDSVAETDAAWRALPRADRFEAVRRYSEWLGAKGARKAIAGLPTYLSEKRWTMLGQPAAAKAPGADEARVPAFDRTWWWVWSQAARRGLSADEKRYVSGALKFGGSWHVDPTRRAEFDAEAGRELTKHPKDGEHARSWRAYWRSRGVEMPIPDKVEWVFLPPTGPPETEGKSGLTEADRAYAAEGVG